MYKIMIADDEPIVLDSLKTFPWSDHQCCVTCFAENGLNALHTLESEKVDILISDIRMPGMNGLELSKAVKERFPETEIILLTGYAEFEYAKQALSLGIRQYLLKPFRFEDIESALLSCIHSLITWKAGADSRHTSRKSFSSSLLFSQSRSTRIC